MSEKAPDLTPEQRRINHERALELEEAEMHSSMVKESQGLDIKPMDILHEDALEENEDHEFGKRREKILSKIVEDFGFDEAEAKAFRTIISRIGDIPSWLEELKDLSDERPLIFDAFKRYLKDIK